MEYEVGKKEKNAGGLSIFAGHLDGGAVNWEGEIPVGEASLGERSRVKVGQVKHPNREIKDSVVYMSQEFRKEV